MFAAICIARPQWRNSLSTVTPWATLWATRGGKGMSKRAKQSNLTCFVGFLRHFIAITPLKCQFSSSCSTCWYFWTRSGHRRVHYFQECWYHCGKPITNWILSNLYLILPENTHEQSLVKDQFCSWAGQTYRNFHCTHWFEWKKKLGWFWQNIPTVFARSAGSYIMFYFFQDLQNKIANIVSSVYT